MQNKSTLEYNKFQETQLRWLIDQYQQLAAKEPDEFPRRHWLYQVESLARQLKDAPLFEQTRRAAFKITPLDPRWTLPSKLYDNPLVWMVLVDGFMVDIRKARLELQKEAFRLGLIPFVPADKI